MKTKTINLSDVESCPLHIVAPEHWFPVHRVEECHPELRERLKNYDETVHKPSMRHVRKSINNIRQAYIEALRSEDVATPQQGVNDG